MKKNISISVGIPIFNEEKTIGELIQMILLQKAVNIKEIIIALDGSTDGSYEKIKLINDKRIILIHGEKRLGKTHRLTQLLSSCNGDVLILLDGDVTITQKMLFSHILRRYEENKADLIGVHPFPLNPTNFFQRVLKASVIFQDEIKSKWNHGDNYLSFKGNMLLLSRSFAKKIHLPEKLVNDDAFFYFFAKKKSIKTYYAQQETIYYTLPHHFSDHRKQALRFYKSKDELQRFFSPNVLLYAIPKVISYKAFIRTIMKEHIYFISYLFLRFLTLITLFEQIQPTWKIASTTKGGSYE